MVQEVDWQVLFVDDEEDFCRQVKDYLEGEKLSESGQRLQVTTLNNFSEALERIEKQRFDLIILDVRLGSRELSKKSEEEAGTQTFKAIRGRRFLPIIFYTALPKQVEHLKSPVVYVVEKTAGLPCLLNAVKAVFETRLPDMNRALIHHLEKVQCEYMWEFVADHWDELTSGSDSTTLAYLLARRLSLSLSLNELATVLGASATVAEDCVHPAQYYIVPPIFDKFFTGDLFEGRIGEYNGYWILLTPTCDIWSRKADRLLLAFCIPLENVEEYKNWVGSPSNNALGNLKMVLQDRGPERYCFLPGVFEIPDLIVNFQHLVSLPQDEIKDSLKRVASLDSPFASKLLARFVRYYGRHGAPNLDVDILMARLQQRIAISQVASGKQELG